MLWCLTAICPYLLAIYQQGLQPVFPLDLQGKSPLNGGWGLTQWESPPEEWVTTLPLSSEAITTAVPRAVVDETENFFNAFLPPGELQGVMNIQIVSVPPTGGYRRRMMRKGRLWLRTMWTLTRQGWRRPTDLKNRKLMRTWQSPKVNGLPQKSSSFRHQTLQSWLHN